MTAWRQSWIMFSEKIKKTGIVVIGEIGQLHRVLRPPSLILGVVRATHPPNLRRPTVRESMLASLDEDPSAALS